MKIQELENHFIDSICQSIVGEHITMFSIKKIIKENQRYIINFRNKEYEMVIKRNNKLPGEPSWQYHMPSITVTLKKQNNHHIYKSIIIMDKPLKDKNNFNCFWECLKSAIWQINKELDNQNYSIKPTICTNYYHTMFNYIKTPKL